MTIYFHNTRFLAEPTTGSRKEVNQYTFWNLWQRRFPPAGELAVGDTVVLVDAWPGGSRLSWETTVKAVDCGTYSRKHEAISAVAALVGLSYEDVRDEPYTAAKSDVGGMYLAWLPSAVRRLDLPRPPGLRMGQHGWAVVDDPSLLRAWGLVDGAAPASRGPGSGAPTQAGEGQGRRLDAAANRAVEKRAVVLARAWCKRQGWTAIADVGDRKSWDLEATTGQGRLRFLEVKGTTGEKTDVYVTAGEVQAARAHGKDHALLIATGISVTVDANNRPVASGGQLHAVDPWQPKDSDLIDIQYRWTGQATLAT